MRIMGMISVYNTNRSEVTHNASINKTGISNGLSSAYHQTIVSNNLILSIEPLERNFVVI